MTDADTLIVDIEAPRGGAGIEICRRPISLTPSRKPLVEGLVLKLHYKRRILHYLEAPRGGAGIEILTYALADVS